MNLTRRKPGVHRGRTTATSIAKRAELVELYAATPALRTTARYTVRVGKVSIEVSDDFDAGALRRLVAALAC